MARLNTVYYDRQGRRMSRRRFAGLAAAIAVAAATPLKHGLAASKLKIGILLPRSGPQGQIGADCLRGVEVGVPLLKAKGYPELELMHADTETKVNLARSQAEKLISGGAQLIIGAFDSGATMAAAQVCGGKPLVVLPKSVAVTKPTWPMRGWRKRGWRHWRRTGLPALTFRLPSMSLHEG